MSLRGEILIVLAMLLCSAGAGCGPSETQIRAMKDWSSAARASCRVPGQCPDAESCIRSVFAATEKDAGRTEYVQAQTACWPYGGAE